MRWGSAERTRREIFLSELEQVVRWSALLTVIAPHYPKSGNRARQPYPLETMLCVHLMQQWCALSAPAMGEALYDTPCRQFAHLSVLTDIPDETTILNFRRLLECNGLAAKIFAAMNAHLAKQQKTLRTGTIVDATIVNAPSSTKNSSRKRDPKMHQATKDNQWYFNMKTHIGVDADIGLVHTVTCMPASVADVTQVDKLLHRKEKTVHGDAGNTGIGSHREHDGRAVKQHIAERRSTAKKRPKGRLKRLTKELEMLKARLRTRVEHPFRVLKRQF